MKCLLSALVALMLATSVTADSVATDALNGMRAESNRQSLDLVPALTRAAQAHARDMAEGQFFDHRGSDGSDVGTRLRRAGYQWCWAAENIAKGQPSLGAVLSTWAKSPGHAKNMLHQKARGVGIARGKGDVWVMVLAAPC